MKCPNCKHEQEAGQAECQACQVNFEKWAQKEARRAGAPLAAAAPAEPVPAGLLADAGSSGPSKPLKDAAAAGMVIACFTLLALGLSVSGVLETGLDAWAIIDVAALLGLSAGVYCKSRVCAVTLFLYYVVGKIAMFVSAPRFSPGGIAMSLYFAGLFGRGAMASFEKNR